MSAPSCFAVFGGTLSGVGSLAQQTQLTDEMRVGASERVIDRH
jgi:hypothetical protein